MTKNFQTTTKNENNQSTRKNERKIIKVQIKWMNVFVSDDYV